MIYKYYGPPGTGKTYKLISRAKAYHRTGTPLHRIGYFAFTKKAATEAKKQGLGVNAGHDLDLNNLAKFLTIPDILEVSIGHALIVECIEQGMVSVINQYLNICRTNSE